MLEISININDNEIIVQPKGRIDSVTSTIFQEECQNIISDADTLIVDFADVDYLPSAGLRVILVLQQIQDEQERILKLRNVNELITETFESVGFLDFLVIE